MLAMADPSARLRLVSTRSRRALRTAASVSGRRTSSAMTTPTADAGAPIASTASSMAFDSVFASPTTEDERDEQQGQAHDGLAVRRRVRVLVGGVVADGEQIVAVAHGLHEHEQPVERDRRDGRERELGAGELRARRARREAREDEAQRREGG